MFEIGDALVCVDVSPNQEWAFWLGDAEYVTKYLKYGGPYRVSRSILEGGPQMIDVGCAAPGDNDGLEDHLDGMWPAIRFRKIDSEVTEDFREMLRKIPAKDKQDARL